jgi:hypothetical protein
MKFNVERMLPPQARKPDADVSELPALSPTEIDKRLSYSLTWGWSSKHRKDKSKKKNPQAA